MTNALKSIVKYEFIDLNEKNSIFFLVKHINMLLLMTGFVEISDLFSSNMPN
jgi:hypothetical protein